MRFHRLDLNLLVALDALLTWQNVTRAAERLCLSQSAMSGCLSRLRAHFEDELIVQVGRHMVFTPPARSLAGPLRELRAQTELLVTVIPPSIAPSDQISCSSRPHSRIAGDMQTCGTGAAEEAPRQGHDHMRPRRASKFRAR